MSDIGPGDKVVCVEDAPIPCIHGKHRGTHVSTGMCSVVISVGLASCGICPTLFLGNGARGIMSRFRKLESDPDLSEVTRQIRACRPTIPELKPVKVEIVRLDPAIWGDVETWAEGERL